MLILMFYCFVKELLIYFRFLSILLILLLQSNEVLFSENMNEFARKELLTMIQQLLLEA